MNRLQWQGASPRFAIKDGNFALRGQFRRVAGTTQTSLYEWFLKFWILPEMRRKCGAKFLRREVEAQWSV
jgi:hypothetical protein